VDQALLRLRRWLNHRLLRRCILLWLRDMLRLSRLCKLLWLRCVLRLSRLCILLWLRCAVLRLHGRRCHRRLRRGIGLARRLGFRHYARRE